MSSLRVHIGHHFFGAGNVGDDFMLAGFLSFLKSNPCLVELTCCIPFDLDPMRRRFSEIRWYSYNPAERDTLVAGCDVWLGLGGSPFQTTSGPWFMEHLAGELELCRRHGKPMYFLGVGVNDAAALGRPETRGVVEYAEHVWTRDDQSAELLAGVAGSRNITGGADLAHLWLGDQRFASPESGVAGYLLNFESPQAFDPAALESLVAGGKASEHRWLVQEVRDFPGTEQALLKMLPGPVRDGLSVRLPNYAGGSMRSIIDAWGVPETLVTSRYHGAIVGAWIGSRVLPVWRNEKVVGLSRQLGLGGVADLTDPVIVRQALDEARPVPAASLRVLSERAASCCGDFFHRIAG